MLLKLENENVLELESFNRNGDRYYIIPQSGVAVPSVTSVIYKGVNFPDTPVMKLARDRGTRVHEVCEQYLIEGKVSGIDHFTRDSFNKLQVEIDKYLTEVNLIEGSLYSNKLLSAGRVDCIGVWDGRKSIVDWKTATNPKKLTGIKSYFIQAAAYAFMWNEHCSDCANVISQLVVLVTPDNHPCAQIFAEPYDKYYEEIYKKFVLDRQ